MADRSVTVHEKVCEVLSGGGWFTPHQVQAHLVPMGTWISESAVTARIRDLRKDHFGHHSVIKRRRDGTNYFEYRILSASELAVTSSIERDVAA